MSDTLVVLIAGVVGMQQLWTLFPDLAASLVAMGLTPQTLLAGAVIAALAGFAHER